VENLDALVSLAMAGTGAVHAARVEVACMGPGSSKDAAVPESTAFLTCAHERINALAAVRS
jgi:hypothetical protein